jgi:leader peptidase (prepilin peptidase)/N-methyltransferase
MGWDYLDLLNLPFRSRSFWVPFAFVFGAMVGSLLNVVILRLPRAKSLWWPSSRCGACYQAIPGSLNLPLITYLWLRGRCRVCGAGFSSRYFWIELLTATGFAALFWLEVAADVRGVTGAAAGRYFVPVAPLAAVWAYHAVLLSCLIAAVFIDLAHGQVPRSLLVFGLVVGVIGGALGPWPWPAGDYTTGAVPLGAVGLQTRPVWTPPFGLRPGSAALGLATSLAGVLAGWVGDSVLRWVAPRALPSESPGLLTMIGAYTGWQVLLLAVVGAALAWWLARRVTVARLSPFLTAAALISLLAFHRLREAALN